MFAYCGHNGFRQFDVEHERKLPVLRALKLDENEMLISASWSYTAYAVGRQVRLRGLLAGSPNACLTAEAPSEIVQLSATDRFCLLLLADGRVFKLTPQLNAALVQVQFSAEQPTSSLAQKRDIFGVCRSVPALRITHIACGTNITVAISSDNSVYCGPSKLAQLPKQLRVKQLCCGFEHALLLSGNGDIYCWGNGLRGQLGQQNLAVEETPLLLEALAGIKITCIAAAGWHSAAVSAFGDLYTWGFNSNGQLGLPLFKTDVAAVPLKQPKVYPLPQLIDEFNCCEESECSPVKVWAGTRHTVVRMSCGALMVAGWNAYGQLSLDRDAECVDSFEKMSLPSDCREVTEVVCGPWSTIVKYDK